MSDSANTAIVVRSALNLAEVSELEQILIGEKEPPKIVDDPADIQHEMLLQILGAESDEELEIFGNTISMREIARRFVSHDGLPVQPGTPFEIVTPGFRWRPSDFDGEGMAVYFIVFGKSLETGERLTLTTGSGSVMAQLANRAKRGTLIGAQVLATEPEKSTGRSRWPYALVSVGQAGDTGEENAHLAEVVDED